MGAHRQGIGSKRRGAAAVVLLAAALASVPASAGQFSVVLDQVVAVVAGRFQGSVPPQIVTRWDLEAECRLESIVRYGASGVDRPISKSLRAVTLERIVDESVIRREAVRLDGGEVEEASIDEAFSKLAGAPGEGVDLEDLLEEAMIPRSKVRAILARRLVADRYVLDSLRLTMSFTESELEAAFENMVHPFEGAELEDVHDAFRDFLLEVKADQHREELIDDLATRCRIWIFLNPGALES
jgi:hypothetical protein